jgi:hypothetical protein
MGRPTEMQEYAQNALAEKISYELTGFMDPNDAESAIEDLENDFDGDSYCPYYSQQEEVIRELESDFWRDAEDICDSGQTYKASEFQQAQTAYAYALAYTAFNHYFSMAKQEVIDAISEFVDDTQSELETQQDIRIQFSSSCTHGWAAHNRELEDGTMIFESGQLDGCNGLARQVAGVWMSCCIDPQSEPKEEDATETAS